MTTPTTSRRQSPPPPPPPPPTKTNTDSNTRSISMTTTRTRTRTTSSKLVQFISSPRNSPWIGLLIRLVLAVILPALMDHSTQVPYTDIDFYVFTDAAVYLQEGLSPYTRHTYRYTPYLAWFIAKVCLPIHVEVTRYIFCIADTICGYIILQMRQQQRQKQKQQKQSKKHDGTDPSSAGSLLLDPSSSSSSSLIDACWWLYNPLAINICTRGSSESLMVLLPVLATYWCASQCQQRQCSASDNRSGSSSSGTITTSTSTHLMIIRWWTMLTGIVHGWSIHSKLYPIIYTGSYMTYFATIINVTASPSPSTTTKTTTTMTKTTTKFPWFEPFRLLKLIQLWIERFFLQAPFLPMVFLVSTLLSFSLSTYLAIYWFGDETLEESLLYHFGRVDHRHNYSMYWYWIYLERSRSSDNSISSYDDALGDFASITTTTPTTNFLSLSNLGKILLIPQAVLLVYSSLGLVGSGGGGGAGGGTDRGKPQRLALALFVQTYLFVTHNKVITAQYFTWYLCLLPLCCYTSNGDSNDDQDNNTKKTKKKKIRRMVISLVVLLCSIVFWLLSAYCLEMQGMTVHRVNWIASVCYFAANVNVLGSFLSFFEVDPQEQEQQQRQQQQDEEEEKKKKKKR